LWASASVRFVALALAPASGEETRQQLSETASDILETANESIRDVKNSVQGAVGNKPAGQPDVETQAS
jgi:hypothetical protein